MKLGRSAWWVGLAPLRTVIYFLKTLRAEAWDGGMGRGVAVHACHPDLGHWGKKTMNSRLAKLPSEFEVSLGYHTEILSQTDKQTNLSRDIRMLLFVCLLSNHYWAAAMFWGLASYCGPCSCDVYPRVYWVMLQTLMSWKLKNFCTYAHWPETIAQGSVNILFLIKAIVRLLPFKISLEDLLEEGQSAYMDSSSWCWEWVRNILCWKTKRLVLGEEV